MRELVETTHYVDPATGEPYAPEASYCKSFGVRTAA
jgi:hypothetical protein